MRRWVVALSAVAVSTAGACTDDESSATEAVIDPGDDGNYQVEIAPEHFTGIVDNPYMPLLPGSRWRYEETTFEGEVETITVEVLDEHRTVMGVDTIVVHDVVEGPDGEVIEDTFDWYAQDSDGSVWYFGEDTTSYDEGVKSNEGSWEAGVNGALPGIVMPADPEVSTRGYRQEYLAGQAEDMGQIIADDGTVTTPVGTFDEVVRTRDWTPLEPDVIEEKTYAKGIGLVHEQKVTESDRPEEVVLVDFKPGTHL